MGPAMAGWQGRFASFVMDEPHRLSATRYGELNPVRARLARSPGEYPWSSARAHLQGEDDALVTVAPLLRLEPDWQRSLSLSLTEGEAATLRQHERTGRPAGSDGFVATMEALTGRILRRQKPGTRWPPRRRS